MSRLSILVSVFVLSVRALSTIRQWSATMRHHAKAQPISAQGSERYFGGPKSECWRDSNAANSGRPIDSVEHSTRGAGRRPPVASEVAPNADIGPRPIGPAGSCQARENTLARQLLHPTPLGRRETHVALESSLESRFRLIPHRLRHGAGGKRRFSQFGRCERHPDIQQKIAGPANQLLLELTRERRPRHVAQARQVGQRPWACRLVEQSRHRRGQPRVPGQGKNAAGRVLSLAGEPQREREHRRR